MGMASGTGSCTAWSKLGAYIKSSGSPGCVCSSVLSFEERSEEEEDLVVVEEERVEGEEEQVTGNSLSFSTSSTKASASNVNGAPRRLKAVTGSAKAERDALVWWKPSYTPRAVCLAFNVYDISRVIPPWERRV